MQVIRDDIREGKSDKQIYDRLTTEYGEAILYSPAFDAQTAVLWLGPVRPLSYTVLSKSGPFGVSKLLVITRN